MQGGGIFLRSLNDVLQQMQVGKMVGKFHMVTYESIVKNTDFCMMYDNN